MLRLHILNVGHGNSAIVEFNSGSQRFFGLIDSNASRGVPPRALSILNDLGAERLSFVCLTHPHADHFLGLRDVIQTYDQRIDHFYTFPWGDIIHNKARLIKWARALKSILDTTDDDDLRNSTQELMWILKWATHNKQIWSECDGDESRLAPNGFSSIDLHVILPPKRAKGSYLQVIDSGNPLALGSSRENDVSLAFRFVYKGVCIVLGGDGSETNWRFRREHFERTSGLRLNALAVNLPHHGSKTDCSDKIIDQLFSSETSAPRYSITSANGQSHPDIEVLQNLERNKILPFCTNLHPSCGGNVTTLQPLEEYEPQLARWVRETSISNGRVQPCQGDIVIEINDEGALEVKPQFDRTCGYRGGYNDLFLLN